MMAVWHGHYTAAETLLKMGSALVDAENEVELFYSSLSHHPNHHVINSVVVLRYAWLR